MTTPPRNTFREIMSYLLREPSTGRMAVLLKQLNETFREERVNAVIRRTTSAIEVGTGE
jgi:hypothetical protein